jgi:hypothetical protein
LIRSLGGRFTVVPISALTWACRLDLTLKPSSVSSTMSHSRGDTKAMSTNRILGTRRSLLTAMGAAAIGISFTACGQKPASEAAKSAGGEEPS